MLDSDAKRHSWTPDKVLHHLVTLRFPCLDLVSGLPVLHVVTLHADVHLYLFICFHFSPQVTECETAVSVTVDCLHVYLHACLVAVFSGSHDFLSLVVSRETSSS